MIDSLTISITISITFILLVGVVFWFRRIRQKESREPFIELEKLVKCRFCGSLIPEGARKCAFCGAWQRQDHSGEQINARKRNGTNAAEIDTSRRMRICVDDSSVVEQRTLPWEGAEAVKRAGAATRWSQVRALPAAPMISA